MKRPYSIVFCFILGIVICTQNCNAQDETYTIHPEIGCTFSHDFFAEAGIMRSTASSKEGDPLMLFGYKLAGECNFTKNNFIAGPKIAVELDPLFIAFRLNLTDYISYGVNDMRLTPEIGGTLFGFATLCVGYNAPLLVARINGLSNFRLALNINFNKAYHNDMHFF